MSVYAIILNEPDEGAWERVSNEWPKHYFLNDSVAFVAPDDPVSLAGEIGEKVGMNADHSVVGIVIEVGSNNGYNYQTLWEWMGKVT